MLEIFKNKLLGRLFTLGILVFCLIAVSRSRGGSSLSPSIEAPTTTQTQEPTITVQAQTSPPLVITSVAPAGEMSSNLQIGEFSFYVINVSPKPIVAYAIKQELTDNGLILGGGVTLYNP